MVIEGVVRGSAQVAQVCNVTVGCVALEKLGVQFSVLETGAAQGWEQKLWLTFTTEEHPYSVAVYHYINDCLKERCIQCHKAAL